MADDFFFSPLEGGLKELLEYRITEILRDPKFTIVSAVLLLKALNYAENPGVRYLQYFSANPKAVHPMAKAAQAVLMAGNIIDASS